MASTTITYQADGLHMQSQLFLPTNISSPQPGIVVFPEAFGLGDHAKDRARRLAAMGYVALACDIHGDGRIIASIEQVMAEVGPLFAEPTKLRERAGNGLAALLECAAVDPARVAAIGYCMGGAMALELARCGADIKAAVAFHSTLSTAMPAGPGMFPGKVLACIGADDPAVPAEQRVAFENEMRGAGMDWQLHLYGGVVHSFTNPEADLVGQPLVMRYDKNADHRSWRAMQNLFDEVFE